VVIVATILLTTNHGKMNKNLLIEVRKRSFLCSNTPKFWRMSMVVAAAASIASVIGKSNRINEAFDMLS